MTEWKKKKKGRDKLFEKTESPRYNILTTGFYFFSKIKREKNKVSHPQKVGEGGWRKEEEKE